MREETKKAGAEAGATQGGRRPSGVAPAASAIAGGLAPGQRWRAARKREVVLRMLRGESVEDYNAQWRVEKNGFVSPRQARQAWFAALSQQAA
jgi:hypothetical protein